MQTDASRLFVSDLDGTLLQADATLSARTRTILEQLLQDGLPFTIATARTIYSALPILEDLPLRLPLILQNGAVLYDPIAKHYCFANCVEPQVCRTVFQMLESQPFTPFVYCLQNDDLRCCYTRLTSDAMRAFVAERERRYQKPFWQVDSLRRLATESVVYLSMTAPAAVLRPLAAQFRLLPQLNVSFYQDVYQTTLWYLELSAHSASKYHGVTQLRKTLGATQVTGFGDNDNDLPLFQACDRTVAVANASPALQRVADEIIDYNTADAVARYLQSHWQPSSAAHQDKNRSSVNNKGEET